MAVADINAEQLRSLVTYNPKTGLFFWSSAGRGRQLGRPAGGPTMYGYWQIRLLGRTYRANRLAWLYMTGKWPEHLVDHINGVKDDNRWTNLRDVPQTINAQNRRSASKRSSTGVFGVQRTKEGYRAKIVVNGSPLSLGTYRTPEEAGAVYLEAKRLHHSGCTI